MTGEDLETMKANFQTLQQKAYETAVANSLLHGTVRVKAKVLSIEEAIGKPEEKAVSGEWMGSFCCHLP
jgi:hypothetical protein